MQNLKFEPAYEIGEKIRQGRVTSVDVANSVINQISKLNKDINAVVTYDSQKVLEEAGRADDLVRQNKKTGPLHGVPVTIKDVFETSGMRTTSSHKAYENNIPLEDATVVRRLREAGAIILGKTNLPELAMDCQTDSPLFGRTNNPWDFERTAGGSSGGSAAAVASGMSFMDIGNDLLGSVRIPSHFCGIYSLVPTEKLVPNTGILTGKQAYGTLRSFMRVGIMARSIRDLELGLSIIAGPDEEEIDVAPVNINTEQLFDLNNIRVAWTDNPGGLTASNDTSQAIKGFIEKLKARGIKTKKINKEDFDFNAARNVFLRFFYTVIGAEIPAVFRLLARYLGRKKYFDMSMKKYLEAEKIRYGLVKQIEGLFSGWDVLVCPVTATPAFTHMKADSYIGINPVYKKGINVDGTEVNYAAANMGFTIPFNVTGSPVVTIPVGFSSEGLPIGVQLVGKRFSDQKLLSIAQVLSDIADSFRNPQL
ncbi:MAG: amidase [Clostridia bacterium]|nr:amidase [Clostridia bacterium]